MIVITPGLILIVAIIYFLLKKRPPIDNPVDTSPLPDPSGYVVVSPAVVIILIIVTCIVCVLLFSHVLDRP